MITMMDQSGQSIYALVTYVCDDDNDIPELEQIAESVPAGSAALIIDGSKVLMRRHNKNSSGNYWQEI